MNPGTEMRMEIEGTTYIVSTYCANGEETVLEKIARLVREDENIVEKNAGLAL